MVTAGSGRTGLVAYGIAAGAVAPLVAASVWSGFRLGTADQILAVLSAAEEPLTVRTPAGVWLWMLVLAWFVCAYRQRAYSAWEPLLVALAAAVALPRVGNAWFAALLLLAPLARRARLVPAATASILTLFGLAIAVALLIITRPPDLPVAAQQAASALPARRVLADWHWAGSLQTQGQPYATTGLMSEPTEFWIDYLRVSQGHAHWQRVLDDLAVDVLVLDPADQQAHAAVLVRASDDWRVVLDAPTVLVAARAR